MKQIEKIISEISEFPTLPTIYTELHNTMERPNATAKDVAKIISTDQAAATKVLKAINSPIYGLRGKISSIDQSIVYLGFNEVKNLVLALSVIEMFSKVKGVDTIKPKDFWSYSMGVGILARKIGVAVKAPNVDDYFISGILHCIGRLIFLKTIPELFSQVLSFAKENRVLTREVEKDIIGMTHTIAGQLLFEKWKLPKMLQDTVSNQYIGQCDGGDERLVASIHLAMIAANMMKLGESGDYRVPKLNFVIWETLNLDKDFFTSNLSSFETEYHDTVNLLLN